MSTQASTIAAALCIPAVNTPFATAHGCDLLPIPEHFFTGPTMLRGRKEAECCEQDPSWKQLLPYAVVSDDAGLIYCYTRGKAGGEGRLHGNISIGLGGHVDVAPAEGQSLKALLVEECNRELMEEANLPSAPLEFIGLICDPTNDVGRVHLGLLTVRAISANEKAGMLNEPGIIEKGEFVSLEHLLREDVFARLENWSKCAVLHFAGRR